MLLFACSFDGDGSQEDLPLIRSVHVGVMVCAEVRSTKYKLAAFDYWNRHKSSTECPMCFVLL